MGCWGGVFRDNALPTKRHEFETKDHDSRYRPNFPESPCFDSSGKLWFTECKAGCLTCFADGKLERLAAGGKIDCLSFDAADDIWFTDPESHKLRKYLRREQCFEGVLERAGANGCDVDKPRNLAKSVTVE